MKDNYENIGKLIIESSLLKDEIEVVNDVLTYDQCIEKVNSGIIDWCIGDYWISVDRMQKTNFIMPFEQIKIAMVTLTIDQDSTGYFVIFNHIDINIWYTVIGFQVILAFLYLIYESNYNKLELGEKNIFSNLVNVFMSSIIGLFSGRSINKPMTIPGKLVILSISLFYLVFYALFMASTTSDFMIHQTKTSCNNLDCLLSEKKLLFLYSNFSETFNNNYPKFDLYGLILQHNHIENYSKATLPSDIYYKEMYLSLLSLLKGYTSAILMPYSDIYSLQLLMQDFEPLMAQDGLDRNYCKYLVTTYLDIPETIQTGMPISQELHHYMSYVKESLVENGVMQKYFDIYKTSLMTKAYDLKGLELCEAQKYFLKADPKKPILFYGVMIFIAIFFGIAMFFKIITIIWDNFMKENYEKSMKANTILFNKYFKRKEKKSKNPIVEDRFNGSLLKSTITAKLINLDLNKKDIYDILDEKPFKSIEDEMEYIHYTQKLMLNKINLYTKYPNYLKQKREFKKNFQNKKCVYNLIKSVEVFIDNNGKSFPIDKNRFLNTHEMSKNAYLMFKSIDDTLLQDMDLLIQKYIDTTEDDYEKYLENNEGIINRCSFRESLIN